MHVLSAAAKTIGRQSVLTAQDAARVGLYNDLEGLGWREIAGGILRLQREVICSDRRGGTTDRLDCRSNGDNAQPRRQSAARQRPEVGRNAADDKIGRASCRER